MAEKLRAEWPGVLAWMIDGCLAWQRQGLNPPAKVAEATRAYFESQDAGGRWIEEEFVLDPNAEEKRDHLWAAWRSWATDAGEYVGTCELKSAVSRLAVFMSGLLLSSQLARAAEITIEGDAPLKSITVTLEGGTSKDVVRELSQKYGFEVQGLDNINSNASLSTTMSGNLRSIVESLLRNCNYMLFRSTDNKSGIDRVIIVNCTHGPAPSPGRTQDQPTDIRQQQLLDAGQLDQLVAPVALYADPLLAQVLVASTYPLEVVQAESFAKANKKLKGDKLKEALAKQDWDTSVKELVSIPPVLAMMNDKLDWTQSLGDAVLAQQADVMDAIQRLRAKAHSNGKLELTEQQTVMVTQEAEQRVIEIEPASPEVVYVPYYDPAVVYGEWPYPDYPPYYYAPPNYIVGGAIATGLAWGAAYLIGRAIWDDIDWDRGDINIDIDRDIDIGRNANIDGDFKKLEAQLLPSAWRGVRQ